MLHVLRLLVPALIPSWRFFKSVEPSPRVQFTWLMDRLQPPTDWTPFTPRFETLRPRRAARQLFWNPHWNEGLYLVTLAERLMVAPTPHSITEINRILLARHRPKIAARYVQFRLVFIRREGMQILEEVTYLSDPHEL